MNTVDIPSRNPVRPTILRCVATDLEAGGSWLFWSAPPSFSLRSNLQRHGQLMPVLVDASGSRPVLVAGSARVAALAELGREVLCMDLGALDGQARGLAYIQSNSGRELSDGQIVLAMRYFAALPASDMPIVREALGLEPRCKRLRLVRSWLTLPASWDALLRAGTVPLACAELLEAFAPTDIMALEALFATLSWSRGNAVNVLTWIRETCVRDGVSVEALLDGVGLGEILAADLSPKDAMTRIAHAARLLRYPVLSGMERDFNETVRRVTAGTRWRMVQPDLFESNAVELRVRLTSPEELRAASAELVRVAAREDLAGLFPVGRK
jgi:ParB family chromosome partitioning protein